MPSDFDFAASLSGADVSLSLTLSNSGTDRVRLVDEMTMKKKLLVIAALPGSCPV